METWCSKRARRASAKCSSRARFSAWCSRSRRSADPGERSMNKMSIRQGAYLDWNATTPLGEAAREAMDRARPLAWGNPSSIHGHGRHARGVLEAAREAIAGRLRVHPKDVLFTGSATEANHLALSGAT